MPGKKLGTVKPSTVCRLMTTHSKSPAHEHRLNARTNVNYERVHGYEPPMERSMSSELTRERLADMPLKVEMRGILIPFFRP